MYLNALVLVSGGCDEPATDANTRTDFFYPLRKLKKKLNFPFIPCTRIDLST